MSIKVTGHKKIQNGQVEKELNDIMQELGIHITTNHENNLPPTTTSLFVNEAAPAPAPITITDIPSNDEYICFIHPKSDTKYSKKITPSPPSPIVAVENTTTSSSDSNRSPAINITTTTTVSKEYNHYRRKSISYSVKSNNIPNSLRRGSTSLLHNPFTRCGLCRESMVEGQGLFALGQWWHSEHFVCSHCFSAFPNGKFYEYDSKPYCKDDYILLFGEFCDSCQGLIIGNCISALNKKWHPEHFICTKCHISLTSVPFVEKHTLPYCKICAETILQYSEYNDIKSKIICSKCGIFLEDRECKRFNNSEIVYCGKCYEVLHRSTISKQKKY